MVRGGPRGCGVERSGGESCEQEAGGVMSWMGPGTWPKTYSSEVIRAADRNFRAGIMRGR